MVSGSTHTICKIDQTRAPFNLELPLPPASFKERKGRGKWGQPRKEAGQSKQVDALDLQRHTQVWRPHPAEAFAQVARSLA